MKRLAISILAILLFCLPLFAEGYVYGTLSKEDKAFYDRMADAVFATEPSIEVGDYTAEDCIKMLSFVKDDYPGLFWVGDSITYRTSLSKEGKIVHTVTFSYTHQDNLEQDKRTFVNLVSKFHNYIKDDPNDWLKLYHIYDYLASTIRYDNSYMDQSMWSVFFDGVGVCAGFARSFQYLAHLEGIPCIIVTGYERDESGKAGKVPHAWVMAQVEGAWYHFDPTWGIKDSHGNTDFTYFCRSTERMNLTHVIDSDYPLPPSGDDTLSYINMRHRYMGTYSRSLYTSIVSSAVKNKEYSVTVEFDSALELEKAVRDLFTDKGIMDVFRSLDKKFTKYSWGKNDRSYALKLSMEE